MNSNLGVFAFRFPEAGPWGLLDLFAVGRQNVRDASYRWHGRERTDGPLYLFQYTRAGTGLLETGGQSWTLGPGQGFLVEIPSDHVYRLPAGSPGWDITFVLFRPAGAQKLWSQACLPGPVAAFPPGGRVVGALEALVDAAALGRIRDAFTASKALYEVVVELARHAAGAVSPLPAAIVKAQALLDEGWNRPWKLPEVARAVGLSPSHFHRRFRQHTGLTPLDWLTRRRMEKAVELLGGDTTVEAVARTLGFSDTGHFIRLFRRWTGHTPGALKSNSAWTGSKIVLS